MMIRFVLSLCLYNTQLFPINKKVFIVSMTAEVEKVSNSMSKKKKK